MAGSGVRTQMNLVSEPIPLMYRPPLCVQIYTMCKEQHTDSGSPWTWRLRNNLTTHHIQEVDSRAGEEHSIS